MLPRDDDRTESCTLWQKQHLLELFKKRRITTNMQISAQGKKPAKSPIPLEPLNSKYAGHRQKPSKKQTNKSEPTLYSPDSKREPKVFRSPVLGERSTMLACISGRRGVPVPGQTSRRLEERRFRPTHLRGKW